MTNTNIYSDMLKQTHILIAGQTGSGKSVVINGIISALLSQNNPFNLILIDPKRVELVEYRNLPNTVKYASEPDEMIEALEWAMGYCDVIYKGMQSSGMKKYHGRHTYVIIDELADLMTTDKKRAMPLIQRLCQIGRASNVHVIAATQCPLVEIIPTKIKVNFTAKVALKVACAQHSRNIMDKNGCELLPKYGKAYYITPDGESLIDVPMVEDAEREALIESKMPKPEPKPVKVIKSEPKPEPKPEPVPEPAPTPRRKGLFGWLFA